MAVTNGWGQGVENNTIEWGKGKDNATNNWGKIYETSASGDTLLEVATPPAPSFSNTKSVDFDGVDDNVVLSSTTNLRPTEAELNASGFTVSLWVKQDSSSTQGFFANDGVGQTNLYGLEFNVKSTGKFAMQKGDGGASSPNNRSSAETTTTVLALNTWTHVMYVMPSANKSTWKIYVNGVSQTLTTSGTGSNVAYLNGTAAIGAIRSGKFISGNLDEVAVWNSDQSANIGSIYSASGAVDLSSLNPISWWRMGDGDTFPTLTDNGSGGNNGTMTNMVSGDIVADVPPTFNKFSLNFDGTDDYVDMGDVLDFERTDAFSISLWFKRTRTGVSEFLVDKSESSGNYRGYFLLLPNDDNLITFVLRSSNIHTQRFIVDGTTAITDTNWHHTVLTYDGSSATSGVKIYLDGSDDTGAVTGTLSATTVNSNPFQIGARNGGNTFSGKIDEVAVFNSELSASDVTAIYNGGEPASLTSYSPLAWWRFEEGSGTTATDSGSGGNNGTITNGATYSTDKP